MKNSFDGNTLLFVVTFLLVAFSCAKPDVSKRSVEMIAAQGRGDSIFNNLINVMGDAYVNDNLNDSLAFLILPIEASCPSCRKKTIDSIIEYKHNIKNRHFVIISANGGIQTMKGYFMEQNGDLPVDDNKIFLDSINRAYQLDLCHDRPTIYYTHNRRAYKKVSAVPVTVRDDLREFFSGFRN